MSVAKFLVKILIENSFIPFKFLIILLDLLLIIIRWYSLKPFLRLPSSYRL